MIIFTIISLVVAAIAFYYQYKYYQENLNKLEDAKGFFLPENAYSLVQSEKSKANLIYTEVDNSQLKKLLEELNKYIETNEGTTDFSIIQNKAERYSTTIFESASSNLAFPTYIGLIGTFAGVFLGLIGFEWPEIHRLFVDVDPQDITEGDNISRLVQGVIVSMLTSLCGLIMTTVSNYKATECKRLMDIRKNLFYDFIQNELVPSLGTSVVAALNDLKETLGNFHMSFDVITKNFETTFNSCTERFGVKFKENIDAIANATDKLGSSINAVNDNVERQKELLQELRSNGMMSALDKFISASKQFENTTMAMEDMNEVRDLLNTSTKELVNMQQDYMSSLVVPKMIAERINNILSRISTFEDSVNELGGTLQETQMIGNSEIAMINEHLDMIRRKNALAQEYLETADEKLGNLYAEQTKNIGELTNKYATAIAEHMEEFYDMMDRISDEIDSKKKLFMDKLENAFDVAEINSEFTQLNHLPLIEQEVKTLEGLLIDKDNLMLTIKDVMTQIQSLNTEIKIQGSNNVSVSEKVNNTLQEKYVALIASFESMRELLAMVRDGEDSLKMKIDGLGNNVMDTIHQAEDHLIESVPKDIKSFIEGIISNISALKLEVNNLSQNVMHVETIDLGSIEKLNASINEQERAIEELATSIEDEKSKVESLRIAEELSNVITGVKVEIEGLKRSLTDIIISSGKDEKKPSAN